MRNLLAIDFVIMIIGLLGYRPDLVFDTIINSYEYTDLHI